MNLSSAQQYFVNLVRSQVSMRTTAAGGSSYTVSSRLGDEEIWEDVRLGLNYFNTLGPALTTFSLQDIYNQQQATVTAGGEEAAPETEDINSILITPIVMCALFYTGIRLQFFEAHKHFRYNDNGISIERVKQQDYANIVNGDILSYLTNVLPGIKKAISFRRLNPLHLFSGGISMPRSLVRSLRGVRNSI